MYKNRFGSYLDKLRKEKGVTLQVIADALHMTKPYIHSIIQGNNKPFDSKKNFDIIAALLVLSKEQKYELMDYAANDRGTIPIDVYEYLLQENNDAINYIRELAAKEEKNV